jgi:hypothetical protein
MNDDEVAEQVRRWFTTEDGRDFTEQLLAERVMALRAALEAERAEHRRTAERWDEERRKWYAERERLVAQLATRTHFGLLSHTAPVTP